jgi:hypothetical protein
MDLLTQALMNAQKQRENPYQEAGQGLSSFGNSFINNDREYGGDSPKDRIVASLLTGLTGAVVQGFGAYQERDRRRTLTNDLMGLSSAYYGGEDLNPLVNSLQSQDAKDLVPMLQMEQASSRRALEAETLKEEKKRKLDLEYKLKGEGLMMGQDGGGVMLMPNYANAEAEKTKAKVLAEEEAKAEVKKSMGIGTGLEPKDLITKEDDYRKDFTGSQAFKDYSVSSKGIQSMMSAIKRTDKAGGGIAAKELAVAGVQAIEPGLAVKEGESAALEKSQSIPEYLKGQIRKALNGEASLSPDTQFEILQLAGRRHAEHAKQYGTLKGFYETRLNQLGSKTPNVLEVLPSDYPDIRVDPTTGTAFQIIYDAQGNMVSRKPVGK